MLPPDDARYLADRAIAHTITPDSNMTCIVFKDYLLPRGFDREKSDLLLRFSAGYPDVAPDMWWFDPPIKRADGQVIPATEVVETHMGRNWQRWSRHFTAGQWRSGIDSLQSYFALIRNELLKAAPGAS